MSGRVVHLSFNQAGLWFLHTADPRSCAYVETDVLRLQGRVDERALRDALQELQRRHETLRSTFELLDDEPVQRISEESFLDVSSVDLTHLPEETRPAEAERCVREETLRPFQLATEHPFRATLVRLAADRVWVVMTCHHIAADGWSTLVLFRDLKELYQAALAGGPSNLAPVRTQYRDFVAWQRAWVRTPECTAQLNYWREPFAREPEPLDLPMDRPRGARAGDDCSAYRFSLSEQLSASVRALVARERLSLYRVLLSAYTVLLQRYTGRNQITIGVPTSGRLPPCPREMVHAVGLFTNTIIQTTVVNANEPFLALVRRVDQAIDAGIACSTVPLQHLVAELRPERDAGRHPLFETAFAIDDWSSQIPSFPDLNVEHTHHSGGAKFDLLLTVENERVLRPVFEYRTSLFDMATVARLGRHFQHLLEQIVRDPECRVMDLALLDDEECREIVVKWNDTGRTYPARCAHELFEEQVTRTPDATAVVCQGERITYTELNARANQLAHHLRELGCRPETLVGLAMERSIELVVAVLAILKTGSAYVPLDADYPSARLEYMIGDARPRVVLVRERDRSSLPAGEHQVIALDSLAAELAKRSPENLGRSACADNLVYVIYTSGSTGRPKGVMNTHGGLANHLGWLLERFQFRADDRILQKTPISFDASVWELLLPLACGAQVVLAKPGGHMDPHYLAELVATEGVTTAQFVPSQLSVFVEAHELERCTALRQVIVGGEALSNATVARFQERLDAVLYNLYGATEASDDSSCWRCTAQEPSRVPIGHPIGNVRVYVLDCHLGPLPYGVVGEIHVAGAGLARGYLDRPALTAERFIPDPFSPVPGGRLYRTGDLGQLRDDGTIAYAGRNDHQVKIRGFRIELGEIEAALLALPAIREAAVTARQDATGDKRLVAYIVPERESRITVEDVQQGLAATLPEYMVPSAFVVLEALPSTPNGKLDREALPAPTSEAYQHTDFVPSRSPVEKVVAMIWTELLEIEEVGVDDDFFDLGGHSLLANRLVARLHAWFAVELPLQDFFDGPTIAHIAEWICTQIGRDQAIAEASVILGDQA